MARTENDWRALEKAERLGLEKPGTTARLRAAESGKALPATAESGESDAIAAVMKIAELASSPASFKQRLLELKQAAETAQAQIVAAGRERAAVDKKKADTEADLAKQRQAHEDKIAVEAAAHEAKMKAGADELAARVKAFEEQRAALAREELATKAKAAALKQHLEAAL